MGRSVVVDKDKSEMAVTKTGYIVGAIVGAGIATAALAGAGMRWPPADASQRDKP